MWEIQGEFLSLAPGKSDIAIIEVAGGRRLEVPLAAMSPAARDRIREVLASATSAAAAREPGGPTVAAGIELVTKVEAAASRCRSAREAANMYRLLLAMPGLPSSLAREAEANLIRWVDLEEEGSVRQGKSWVTPDVAEKGEHEAGALVEHAVELMRLGNVKLVLDSLDKASRQGATSIQADFLSALLAILQRVPDFGRAAEHFSEVLERQPGNAAALNNLAVCEVMARRPDLAIRRFREAIERTRDGQAVVDNVGFIVAAANIPRSAGPKMSSKALAEFNELYRTMAQQLALKARAEAGGLTVVGLGGQTCPLSRLTVAESLVLLGDAADGVSGDASWLGVVVAPEMVVTSVEAAVAGRDLAVSSSEGDAVGIPAKVLERLGDTGLALVACEGLKWPALPWAAESPEPGKEIWAVGGERRPLLAISKSVKSGKIVPSKAAGSPLLVHEAAVAEEVAGGAICDVAGRLVGVSVPVSTMSEYKHLRAGISMAVLMPLLRDHVPAASKADADSLDETTLEAKMLESVVVVSTVPKSPVVSSQSTTPEPQ